MGVLLFLLNNKNKKKCIYIYIFVKGKKERKTRKIIHKEVKLVCGGTDINRATQSSLNQGQLFLLNQAIDGLAMAKPAVQ